MLNELKKFIEIQRAEYLLSWQNGNAEKFENDEHYKWMADFLTGYKKVLEIGVGDGRATLELAKRGHKIVSIDENTLCLDAAQQRLESNGFTVFRIKRENITLAPSNKYSIHYSEINCIFSDKIDVYLIDSDILNDRLLIKWLRKLNKFDATICWLIGTNSARIYNEAISIDNMPTPSHYRIFVQNEVYELADEVLRNAGILHIVDRGKKLNTEQLVKEVVLLHEEQASTTSLIVQKTIESRIYEDPTNGYDIGSVTNENTNSAKSNFEKKYLHSIVSMKPDTCL